MEKYQVLQQIEATGVIAIVRGTEPDGIVETAAALYAGGIRVIEVTCNTRGYLEMITALVERMGDKMAIGAGTVLNAVTAQLVIDAGARFILAPNLDVAVIELAHQYGKLVIPGVATPTEMVQACRLGVDVVKLFPAGALGPRYLKEVRGPLNHVAIIPVGGITLENIPEFVKAGAYAFGIGGELVDKQAVATRNYGRLTEKALAFTEAVRQARR